MKTEVYSWRMEPELRQALEDEARRLGASLAEVLDTIANAWVAERRVRQGETEEAEQSRLHAAGRKWIGSVHGDNPSRSERVGDLVRARLKQKRAR